MHSLSLCSVPTKTRAARRSAHAAGLGEASSPDPASAAHDGKNNGGGPESASMSILPLPLLILAGDSSSLLKLKPTRMETPTTLSQALRDRIEATSLTSPAEDLEKLRDDLYKLDYTLPTHIVFTEQDGAVECELHNSFGHYLHPDDQEARSSNDLPQSAFLPIAFVTSVQSSTTRVRYVLALASLHHQKRDTCFTLCWSLDDQKYALIYDALFAYGEDSTDRFWPLARMGKLPTTDDQCSIALLDGSPFDQTTDAAVTSIEAEGLLFGTVARTDTGLLADFGAYLFCEVQMV